MSARFRPSSPLCGFLVSAIQLASSFLPGLARGSSHYNPTFSASGFSSMANMTRAPVIALSHGGGPMPLLGDHASSKIVHSLSHKVPELLKLGTPEAPRAIVLVTAHWRERVPTISIGSSPQLEYDYYGFPPEAYKFKYDAPGAPEIAREIANLLQAANIEADLDDSRGWDHGVFVPMLLVNPPANIPIVQMSVLVDESPERHFKIGQALEALRDKNIAIVGSGFASFHNFRLLGSGRIWQPDFKNENSAWSKALTAIISDPNVEARFKGLSTWRNLPNAYDMHPRGGADHFLPLIVCAGAGGEGQAKSYSDEYMGLDMFSYYWD